MTTMVTELYTALKSAGATEEQATKAAEAVASYDNRFTRIEGELLVLKWMVGANIAGTVTILTKLLFSHAGI